jgi:metallo-beta-lactamase family protein
MFNITHLGGEQQVTGSCHLLQGNGVNILVDCGSVQGADDAVPMDSWPVFPKQLDYVFLTHAHIDHIGRVPELLERGFRGEILTTHATKALLRPMLEDALELTRTPPGKITQLLATLDELSWGFEYGDHFDLKGGLRFKLGRAGHILGSCFIRFESPNSAESVLFSGDLGARDTPLLPDPDVPDAADTVILESTYGDRLHGDRSERMARLGDVLIRALSDRGKVFIPAFALGRTQELIYEMDRLFKEPQFRARLTERKLPASIPVLVDSPLAIEITGIYSRLAEHWDREAVQLQASGDDPLDFEHLYAARSHRDHRKALDMPGPAVIIAGSGMCSGGRIIDHLRDGLEDARNDVLFVGYQARGTLGRAILDQAPRNGGHVTIDGEPRAMRAAVHNLPGYSAHADQRGLIDWVRSMPARPGRIKLVHGEAPARQGLLASLRAFGYHAI